MQLLNVISSVLILQIGFLDKVKRFFVFMPVGENDAVSAAGEMCNP